jgi:hypothetical protein
MEHSAVSQSSTFNLALRQHMHANFNWKGIIIMQCIIPMCSIRKLVLLKAQKTILKLQTSITSSDDWVFIPGAFLLSLLDSEFNFHLKFALQSRFANQIQ